MEKEFGVDMGRATVETKFTKVLYGGGSGGEGFCDWAATPRCTAFYTPVTNIPESSLRRAERRCEKIWRLFPGNLGAEHAELLHSGHLRSLRWVSVMVTGGPRREEYWRIRRPAHDTLSGMLESATKARCSDRPTPIEQSSTGHLPKFQQSSHGTRKRLRSEIAKQEHMELAAGRAVPVRFSITHLCGGTSHSSQTSRTWEQRRKEQRGRGKPRPDRDLHDAGPAHPQGPCPVLTQLALATVDDASRQMIGGGACSLHYCPLSGETEFFENFQQEDRHSSFPTRHKAASEPHARQPAPLCLLYGSALEVWGLLVRLSHCQRAHREDSPWCRSSELPGPAVFQWRQARPLQSTVFRCAQRNSYLRSRTSQMCDPENWATDKPFPNQPNKI